jgi:hypothetical protein
MQGGSGVFLMSQIYRIPIVAIYVVAIVLAILRRRTLGLSSWFTVLGCGLWLMSWLATSALMWWQMTSQDQGVPLEQVGVVSGVIAPVTSLLAAVGTALVLAAALRLGQGSGAPEPRAAATS